MVTLTHIQYIHNQIERMRVLYKRKRHTRSAPQELPVRVRRRFRGETHRLSVYVYDFAKLGSYRK